jgi:hypothetical protein
MQVSKRHFLLSVEGWTSQDRERKHADKGHSLSIKGRQIDSQDIREWVIEEHSQTIKHRGWDKLEHGRRVRE